jgi:phage major head subunit gpT-like protein
MPSTISVANTGGFSQLISRDYKKIMFDEYQRVSEEYKSVANIVTMDGAYQREGSLVGMGAFEGLDEGQPIAYDMFSQGPEKTFYPNDLGLGFAVSEDLYEDDQTGHIKKAFQELGKSAAYTRDLLFWDLLNSGFVTTKRVGSDGAALFSTHTLVDGTTFSNYAATGSALSMTSLQAAYNVFEKNVNEKSIPAPLKPRMLIVPPELRFEAESLLHSEYNPDNANQQVNTIGNKGVDFFVCHFLTSTTAWFLLSDKAYHDLRFFIRKTLTLKSADDFDTSTAKFKGSMRMVADFAGWRGVYGNAGA